MDDLSYELLEPLLRLGLALALGLLIGLERGWEVRGAEEGKRIAGIRTFGVIGLLGAAIAGLTDIFGGLILGAAFLTLGALLIAAYLRQAKVSEDVGITTLAAALMTFSLGALAGLGFLTEASIAAVVLTLLLGAKTELHRFLARIERQELFATIRLLLISVVVLPILPDAGYGPWGVLNPFKLWLMVVLIAGISYVGYVSVMMIGDRKGILVTALLGGLVSSTAVSLNLGRLGKEQPDRHHLLAAGIVGASTMMFPRMLIVSSLISPSLGWSLLAPLAAATAAGLAASVWYARRPYPKGEQGGERHLAPRNPLDLKAATQFGLLLAVIMVLARAVQDWIGEIGLYILAALSGITDVDAIVLSLATMTSTGEATVRVAAVAVLIAAFANSVAKPALVAIIGAPGLAVRVFAPLFAAIVLAAIASWFTLAA